MTPFLACPGKLCLSYTFSLSNMILMPKCHLAASGSTVLKKKITESLEVLGRTGGLEGLVDWGGVQGFGVAEGLGASLREARSYYCAQGLGEVSGGKVLET